MNVEGPLLPDISSPRSEAIVRKWLTHVLETYPEQTSRFLLQTTDPFRNPVGRVLKEGLSLLVDEVVGEFNWTRVTPVLDEIMRVRAVQDFTASQAVGFLFALKQVIREELNPESATLAAVDRRVDELVLRAFDLYAKCRERTHEIKVNEARRRVYVLERAATVRQ